MPPRMSRWIRRVALQLLVLGVVIAGLVAAATYTGLLNPFGLGSKSNDRQIVQAVERTQEVSLVSLSIQGIKDKEQNRELFGKVLPGTSETVFIQYAFQAKLGIDGADVTVDRATGSSLVVSIPEFTFIGYDEPTFKVAAEDGGVLSFVTPDVDRVEMVNEILDVDARQEYLERNEAVLREQAEAFYSAIIASVDPSIAISFEFQS